jgi:beta-galactosidase
VTTEKATMDIDVTVLNQMSEPADAEISNFLMSGKDTVAISTSIVTLPDTSEQKIHFRMEVLNPLLWSVDEPNLYNLVTVVKSNGMTDNVKTPVGFRTLRFDPDLGFFLNGEAMKLKGVCIHHDAGALGSAVPREELSRRLDILKELGCNSIRTSHNPFSPDFNELCDEKGFLVIAEMFDEWELPKNKWLEGWNVGTPGKDGYSEHFEEWAVRDLQDFILRDRNHPSIIMWSIGNEVDYPNDPYTHPLLNTEANPQTWAKFSDKKPHADRLGEVARELVAVVKGLDVTRPTTAGLASALMSNATGYADALDVAGYNYQEFRYEPDHNKYPERPLYGSENGMALEMWEAVEKNDYVMGQYLWTGIEYLGEAGRYPTRSNTAGIIDLAGNRKPEFYFRQSLWSNEPMVFLGTTGRLNERAPVSLWAHKRVDPIWDYDSAQMVSVSAFTNCEEVELFLNSVSVGSKKRADFQNRTIEWEIPFSEGELKAVAKNAGAEVATYNLNTSGEVAELKVECTKTSILANREEIAHIFISLVDINGNLVYRANNEITCEIEGPVKLIGMEDANPSNTDDYKDNKQTAYRGKLLVYLQAMDKPGTAVVRISSEGLETRTINFEVRGMR